MQNFRLLAWKVFELWLFEVSNIGNLLALHYVTRESSSKSEDVDLANNNIYKSCTGVPSPNCAGTSLELRTNTSCQICCQMATCLSALSWSEDMWISSVLFWRFGVRKFLWLPTWLAGTSPPPRASTWPTSRQKLVPMCPTIRNL